MGMLSNLRQMREAMKSGIYSANPTAEQLAAMTPEQREAVGERQAILHKATAEAAVRAREQQANLLAAKPVHGPAGEYLYPEIAQHADLTTAYATMKPTDLLGHSLQQMKQAVTGGAATLPEQPQLDPAQRPACYAHEVAARVAARRPYLPETAVVVQSHRIGAEAGDAVQTLVQHLGATGLAARPDLVYGVYQVPDHIGVGFLQREKKRYVEWEIVHAPHAALPPAAPAGAAFFGAEQRWVGRRTGEPSVLDEDLGLAWLSGAGIGPEGCLGLARVLRTKDVSTGDEGGESYTISHVIGAVALTPVADQSSFQAMAAATPLELPIERAGVHLEVLNWRALARAVHPYSGDPMLLPSPFPYLPSSGAELLFAYLEVVGVLPADCYSAQVTEDGARDLRTAKQKGIFTMTTNLGTSLPCADGTERRRVQGGSRVVVAYRDRPEYAAGRERWAAYEREVLMTALANETGVRRPVESVPWSGAPGGLRGVLRAAEKIADVMYYLDDDNGPTDFDKIPPHRYCWPPADAR
jgi:hypothetical protein